MSSRRPSEQHAGAVSDTGLSVALGRTERSSLDSAGGRRMTSAVATTLLDFVRSFVDETRTCLEGSGVHPSAQAWIHSWLGDMWVAADTGNAPEVKRLTGKVREKIADEEAWHEHCLASAN